MRERDALERAPGAASEERVGHSRLLSASSGVSTMKQFSGLAAATASFCAVASSTAEKRLALRPSRASARVRDVRSDNP